MQLNKQIFEGTWQGKNMFNARVKRLLATRQIAKHLERVSLFKKNMLHNEKPYAPATDFLTILIYDLVLGIMRG